MATKFCQHCGEVIDFECVVCPKCGKQVAQLQQPNIVINNTTTNTNAASNNNTMTSAPRMTFEKAKNKWVAFFLCLFFGVFGLHRFYEGKIGTGILWLCTGGLFCVGWIVDLFKILAKPNPYYV